MGRKPEWTEYIFCTVEFNTVNAKKEDLLVFFLLMREMGLEPTRKSIHMILSHACLPIPALPLIQLSAVLTEPNF